MRLCDASTSSTQVRPGESRIGWPLATRLNGSVGFWRLHVPSIRRPVGVDDDRAAADRLRLRVRRRRRLVPYSTTSTTTLSALARPSVSSWGDPSCERRNRPWVGVPVPSHVVAADHHLGERHRCAGELLTGADVLEDRRPHHRSSTSCGHSAATLAKRLCGASRSSRRKNPGDALAEQLEPRRLQGRVDLLVGAAVGDRRIVERQAAG